MIPIFAAQALIMMGLLAQAASSVAATPSRAAANANASVPAAANASASVPVAANAGASVPAAANSPVKGTPATCLASNDGYLRAKLGGAVDARIDWPNSGTRCEGEFREKPPGVRLSFQRDPGGAPNLLLVFGLTGVKEGLPAREVKANLTVIVQGTSRIYGTLGDSRCTVDSLSQRPLAVKHTYRIEARGFCTQPAHAVRGKGDVLVSTFEFAGPVFYDTRPN
jgi:nucleoid-associated protein YgaU